MRETESVRGEWEGNRKGARATHSNILRAATHNGIPPASNRFLRIQLVAAYCRLRITERVLWHPDDNDDDGDVIVSIVERFPAFTNFSKCPDKHLFDGKTRNIGR